MKFTHTGYPSVGSVFNPILFTLAVRGEPVEPPLPFDKLRANGVGRV
jgi:hypothetical protein